MRTALALSTVALMTVLATPAAHASVTVIGGGLAQECYKAAEYGQGRDTTICDRALDEPMIARDRAATYINRSVLRLRGNDANAALADCDTAIRINSELGEAFVNRGAALMTMGRPQDAVDAISHGIALGIKRMQIAYYDRAMAREDTGDVQGAYQDYKQALAVDPTFAMAQEQLKRFRVVRAEGSSS
jgi:tetratricopeptide (TPR) repeat protein